MEMERERKIFLASCCLWFLLSGIEYSIVLPTILYYFKSVGGGMSYHGYGIAALSFGAMLSAPIYAKVGDQLMSCKLVLRVGLLFSIVGNLIYFAFPIANIIVLARMISGFGWGLEGALMGQIGRTFNQENKTKSLALALITRQFGVIVGPLSVQFFQDINFSFEILGFGITVNQHNFPGFVLFVGWSIVFVLMLFIYRDAEPQPEPNNNYTAVDGESYSSNKYTKKFLCTTQLGIIQEPIIVASICSFATYLLQSGMESLITPFTNHFFGWEPVENAFMYTVVGTIAFLGYLSIQFVSRYTDDRQTLFAGVSACAFVLIAIIIILPLATFRAEWVYPVFYTGMFLFCWFLPYVVASSASILSKAASKDQQSRVQTLRTCGEVSAQIFGPFWVPSSFEISQTPGLAVFEFTILLWQLVFMIICMILTIVSWEYLKPEDVEKYQESLLQENGLDPYPLSNPKIRREEDIFSSQASLPANMISSLAELNKRANGVKL